MSTIKLKSIKLANGETLGYRERDGGDEIILLVHGNMISSFHWDLLLENMDEKYKIYAVDMRGFGISTYYTPISSLKDFSDDIKQFVDALNLKDFTMVGWSTGGGVAMQFAADYPGLCKKLILLESTSTRGYPFFGIDENQNPIRLKTLDEVKQDITKTIPVQTAYDIKDKGFLKALWNMVIYTDHKPNPEKYDKYCDDMFTQRNLAEVYQALNIFNISHVNNGLTAGTGLVSKINIPTLVLRGENDLVVTREMTEEMIEDLGSVATFVELKNCGHSPLIDDLDQLLDVMTKFIDG